MSSEIIKEIGTIVIEVAKNGGTNAVQIFAIIYIIDILKMLISWFFVLLIGKGIFALFSMMIKKVKSDENSN